MSIEPIAAQLAGERGVEHIAAKGEVMNRRRSRALERCKKLKMDSVAVTDHGNIFGAVEFYIKATAAGIKPIIGMESYIAPGSRLSRQKSSISDAAYHLVLLAQNYIGYRNLIELSSTGFVDGFYYRPRIDKEVLAKYNESLIVTTGCLKGEIASLLAAEDEKGAAAAVEGFLKIFGPHRFFIEIQKHIGDDLKVYGIGRFSKTDGRRACRNK